MLYKSTDSNPKSSSKERYADRAAAAIVADHRIVADTRTVSYAVVAATGDSSCCTSRDTKLKVAIEGGALEEVALGPHGAMN